MNLTITDQRGWERRASFGKGIIRIGNAPGNDIQLDAPFVAPVHLQVQHSPGASAGKVLNLGNDIVITRGTTEETLPRYALASLASGDEILLGSFRIRVQFPPLRRVLRQAASFRASLTLQDAILYQAAPLNAWLRLEHTGGADACQFQLTVNGLPADCVQTDPLPLLYSGASEQVRLQFIHHGDRPPAGLQRLTITISAPEQYPGEQVILEQEIYVQPVFAQQIRLQDDVRPDQAAAAAAESRYPAPVPTTAPQAEPAPPPPAPTQSSPPPPPPPKESPAPPTDEQRPQPRRILAANLPDDFWDETS